MIEGLPLDILGYGSGWAILCVVVVMIFRGDLRTAREARAQDRQVESLIRSLETKDRTISEFNENIATSNQMLKAVLEVARERRPGGVS